MRLPNPPASPSDPEAFKRIWSSAPLPEVAVYVRKANAEYYHWDELRRRTPPAGLSAEDAWWLVKFSRLHCRPLPLKDTRGNPFKYWLPDTAMEVLHDVDRQGGGVFAANSSDPAALPDMRDRVLIHSLMEEAIATSQIEGAVTTREAAKEMLRTQRDPRNKSEHMIANGYRTIRLLRERLDRPMSFDLLDEIQESMTRDTLDNPDDAGRFRSPADSIHVVDIRDGEVVYSPPPAEHLKDRVGHLIEFANASDAGDAFVHPLVKASVLHFWLAYEHPYVDGNGRTARALFYWFMLKHGYWMFEFLTISRIIHAAPMQYHRSFLHSERDENDLTYFLMFQLRVTRLALRQLHQYLAQICEEQQRIQSLPLRGLNSRQRAVLEHAAKHPKQIYTFESHRNSHNITYQTARTDLLGLEKRDLLIRMSARQQYQFLPSPKLAQLIARAGQPPKR